MEVFRQTAVGKHKRKHNKQINMKKHKPNYTVIILTFIFVLFWNKGYSSNYYVSNDGNDSANGTSPGTAWKTISHVNSMTFNPGDSILFERGGLWRDELTEISSYGGIITVTESGTPEKYITFGTYGTGKRPRLYGSVASSSFTKISENIYRCDDSIRYDPWNLPTYGQGTWRASIFFKMNDSTTWGDSCVTTSIADLDYNYKWHYQNDSLYFYYDGNITDIDSIEITQKSVGFDVRGGYITIDGFELRYFQHALIGCGTYPETRVDGLNVRNCYLAYSGVREGLVGYGTNLHHSNMLIENNIVHDNGRRNLSFNITAQTGIGCVMRDVIIQNNHCFNGWHTVGVDMSTQGTIHTVRNITIRNNIFYEDPDVNKIKYGVTMNFLENNGDPEDYDSLFFYNNCILNAAGVGLHLTRTGTTFVCNNTFVAYPFSYSGAVTMVSYKGLGSKITHMNNISFIHPTTYGLHINIGGDVKGRDRVTWDTVDYNLTYIGYDGNYYLTHSPSTWAQDNYKQSEWDEITAYGWETHSLVPPQYPHFVDSLYSGKIKASSPAIGKGKAISWITTDIEGTPRDPLKPDIGAYEYKPNNPTKIEPTTSINDILCIFPNPASNSLTVKLSDKSHSSYNIQLYNIQGIKVYESGYTNNDKQIIDITNFSHGVYFIKLFSDDLELKTVKIIIQ